ncbi:heme NO binding domain-containing protein [Alcanivorax sp. MD8A]|uniref:heme NO-binding domain-containing protein n=1 Tax=Alcanivorax sp. MD8A TaxID=1177157 RepID=UPI000C998E4A|nr:heme NO-binding domain-containing protein [Alcanivorax sp. MD8A]PNE03811.1 heme NO binding domain-containing protein [Alcanivorax sp. MD8A]
MHGAIVSNFKRYLDEFLGEGTWGEVINDAGLKGKTYLPVALYPDGEMEALLAAAERATGLRRDDLLADFGEWVIAPMMQMYQAVIPAGANAIDFLLNLQQTHERIVHMKDPSASAPAIVVNRCGSDLVEIRYASQRNMGAMVPGAVKGVAAWFEEEAALLACEPGDGEEVRFVFQFSEAHSSARQAV